MTDTQNPPVAPDTELDERPDADATESGRELEAVLAERDRYLDQLQRTAADLANFRRRIEQERTQQRLAANEQLLREIVPSSTTCNVDWTPCRRINRNRSWPKACAGSSRSS